MMRGVDTWIKFAAGSEKRPNRARHTIVVVNGEQGAPFVEGRARMRDAASDKVGDLRRIASGEAEIRVLVVHRSEEHTSELQSHSDLVCRLLLEKKKKSCQAILGRG